jgi:hypothetical protein
MKKAEKLKVLIADESRPLRRMFSEMNHGFTDWYKATQLEIDLLEEDMIRRLRNGNL